MRQRPLPMVPYRLSVAATELVAVLAATVQQAVTAGTGLLAAGLIGLGHFVSYHRRGHRNVLLKLALAAGLFLAFAAFLSTIRMATTIDDTRVPLATLFLWVLVLHSFDVPRHRDLAFSMSSSVALVALAGSLAFSTAFLVFALPYALLLAASLVVGHYTALRGDQPLMTESSAPPPVRATTVLRPVAAVTAVFLFATMTVFVFLPRIGGARAITLPFSITSRSPIPGFSGEVVHPSQRGGSGDGSISDGTAFDPDDYWGYGDRLDLQVRGTLNDELVLRVRSPRPSLYRAQAFDVYTDGTWTTQAEPDTELTRSGDAIRLPGAGAPNLLESELIQTFYVERALPNLVFHAQRASELYVASSRVMVDDFGSIRLPFILEEDTIYSVISYEPVRAPEVLRTAPPADPGRFELERYLQVPDTLGDRFHELANQITAPHEAAVDKVAAVERWLHANKEYRLEISPDPPGIDPVEFFVFHRDEGFCEQIASTMTLMLRSSGVPARLVTGFGPGDRNLFSGYWEVRNSDAHAWVEVYYPRFGWVPYDPTFGVPLSSAANTTFAVDPLGRLLSGALSGTVGAIPEAFGRLGVAAVPAAVAAVAFIGAMSLLLAHRRQVRSAPPAGPNHRAETAWLEVQDAIRRRYAAERRPDETVHEFVGRAVADRSTKDRALRFTDRFGRLRYGPGPPDGSAMEALEQDARTLRDHLEAARPN